MKRTKKQKLVLLSVGMNQKLAKNIGVFNLPQGITCPGKTAACAKLCYACKAERCYKSAREKRARNYQVVKDVMAQAAGGLAIALSTEIKAAGVSKVRIHESGDFFSQAYFNEWVAVAMVNPGVTFLAYTKSMHLDFSVAPDNMKIYFSTDSTTTMPVPDGRPKAHLVQKGETAPANFYTCKHTAKEHYCGSECTICWAGNYSVYFDQH